MSKGVIPVGRVLRASNRGFTFGCRVMQPDIPVFGSLVRADGRAPGSAIYGLIFDVLVQDDLFVRRFIIADPPEEVVRDQRENRQVPIEVSVLVVGHRHGDTVYHQLPPQPPLSLDVIHTCTSDELVTFTRRFGYFRLVLDCHDLPTDELLAASLRYAAEARDAGGRDYLVEAGRELARLLALDLPRLDAVLRRMRP